MKIVCSSNVQYGREAFSSLGKTVILDDRAITPEQLRDCDILAIRSTLKVNRALIENSSVKFIGTATIGSDHMDIPFLDNKGIKWCSAPGCNANSVSEYVAAALLCLANRHGFKLEGRTIGVIGIGNVGSLVVKKAETLGMRVLQNDPPKAMSASNAESVFVNLEKVLAESDIITMHVPLTKDGNHATFQMADERFFSAMKPGSIFINSARGAVMNTAALLAAMNHGIVSHAVIDTWENEPDYSADLLERADIGTPHIAGYSFEGRVMGTVMVYRQACEFIGQQPVWKPDGLLPAPSVPEVKIDAGSQTDEAVLWNIVRRVYDIETDDTNLRTCKKAACKKDCFRGLRQNYHIRREFRFTRVTLKNASVKLADKISGLGFEADK